MKAYLHLQIQMRPTITPITTKPPASVITIPQTGNMDSCCCSPFRVTVWFPEIYIHKTYYSFKCTLSVRKTKTDAHANSVGPVETASNDPCHQDLHVFHCL